MRKSKVVLLSVLAMCAVKVGAGELKFFQVPPKAVYWYTTVDSNGETWENAVACYEPYYLRGQGIRLQTRSQSYTFPLNAKGFVSSFAFSLPIGCGALTVSPKGFSFLTFHNSDECSGYELKDGQKVFLPNGWWDSVLSHVVPTRQNLHRIEERGERTLAVGVNRYGEDLTCEFDQGGYLVASVAKRPAKRDPSNWVAEGRFVWSPQQCADFPAQIAISLQWNGRVQSQSTMTITRYQPLNSVEDLLALTEVPKGTRVRDVRYRTEWTLQDKGWPTESEVRAAARHSVRTTPVDQPPWWLGIYRFTLTRGVTLLIAAGGVLLGFGAIQLLLRRKKGD